MAVAKTNTFGELLRSWRIARRASQLELGMEAGVSARHISFIETGRAKPSHEMVITLATVLDVPLRERNLLLHAAGYAPLYSETSLDEPQMAQVRRALELILEQQEPFGAVVFDRHWDIVMVNAAYVRFTSLLFSSSHKPVLPLRVISPPRPNLLHKLFDPAGWRPFIRQRDVVARSSVSLFHREMVVERDPATRELLSAIRAYPGVPKRWSEPNFESPQDVIIPIEMLFGDQTLRFFSTIATLGSPHDITLQELRIESFHPADGATADIARSVAARIEL